MIIQKKVTIDVEAVVCDFCKKEGSEEVGVFGCCLCGKDDCQGHGDTDGCEDGFLCHVCAADHEFEFTEDEGGVGVVRKDTGKYVEANWL